MNWKIILLTAFLITLNVILLGQQTDTKESTNSDNINPFADLKLDDNDSSLAIPNISEDKFINRLIYISFGIHYQAVKKFIIIDVKIQSDSEIGLDESKLEDYARLRYKNNFADIEYDGKLANIPENELPPEEQGQEFGTIMINVWTVGAEYPIAYHVSIIGGTTAKFSCHENAFLGISSKIQIENDVKKAIDVLIGTFAIEFFKYRGEL